MKKSKRDPIKFNSDYEEALGAVRTLLTYIGEDPDREGLKKTPARFLNAWRREWGQGYNSIYTTNQINSILGGAFTDGAERCNEMIAVRKIKFYSHCEHHIAEFSGVVDIAYIPNGRVLGLSKLVRVVDMFSKRLQIQERLTNQIADFLVEHCRPIGVGVIIRASHSCMKSRGVHQSETEAITSALRGEMLTEPEVRAEFLNLVGR